MKYKLLLITLFASGLGWGQVAYNMSLGDKTWDFSGAWSVNGATYTGTDAINWASVGVIGTGSSVTTGLRTTKSSAIIATTTTGGFQKPSGTIQFLSTGSTATPEAVAIDLLLNFTGRNAGTLSFDWAAIDNGGTRPTSLRVFWSTNGTTFTEILGAQQLDKESASSPSSGSVSSILLPSNFNGSSTAILRFYNHAGSTTIGSGTRDKFQIDNVSITSTATQTSTTYTTSWTNSAPTASVDAIIDGDLTTTTDLVCKDLTINSGKTLTIGAGNKLTVSGNLINNGTIVFKSSATGTAMFDVFNGAQSGTGVVTVERFIPSGKRAFRLLSPAVTTTNFISDNWQQQTHITGGASGGFDVTETNNPSMFTYNNNASTGSGWTAIANTNATNLTAGVGYRMLVRGDRTASNITAASADSMNTAVTLSATGTLRTGTVTLNSSSTPSINNTSNTTTADYSLIGNPYQSAVDWNAVTKSGIDATYWAWDPNMGTTAQRGRYVSFNGTVNSVDGGVGSSNVGQFIQPGQAFFVKNTTPGTAGTLTFQEAHKATTNANVFRTANPTTLTVSLYDPNELAIGGYPIDATKAVFSADYSNELGLGDAAKLEAAGENIAWFRNNTKLAIEAVTPATSSDELVMKTIRLGANRNYTFKINTTNFDADLTPYLVDNFLNTQTQISTSEVYLANFSTTSNVTSYGEDRFKIVFQNRILDTDDFVKNIKLYPNPAKAGASFYIDGITEATVSVYNVVGQNIPVTVMSQGNTTQVTPTAALSQGVYLVTVTTAGKTAQVKWIVE